MAPPALRDARTLAAAVVLVAFALLPVLAGLIDRPFYVDIAVRLMIWSLAAVSLNLILGYGGMVSFGHAVYLGIGGYTVGVLGDAGIVNGFIVWPLALVLSAAVGLVFGAISLRTKGLYFIMITLALSQMIFFLSISAERYGSDDGLLIDQRNDFVIGSLALSIRDPIVFYYVVFALLLAAITIVHRIVNSRFGMVIQGGRTNDDRLQAIGVPSYRYRLTAFVIAGVICGLAGVLTANFERFISPDLMDWPRSGELIFMVVLGGMGTLFGPVLGAVAFLLLSEILSGFTEHWHLIFGPFLIAVVLFARGGINGLLTPRPAR